MRYLGGKGKISKDIAKIINDEIGRNKSVPFVSLFCGSCSIESKVDANIKILNDAHPYLISLYKALQEGYELPNNVTREQYNWIRAHKDLDPALSGFVGFGCSFGGRWFGGYAIGKRADGVQERNYCNEGKRETLRTFCGVSNAEFYNLDYRAVPIPDNSIIYCDPPYNGTTGYSTGKFNSDEFWDYVRGLSSTHKVFVSEESAPKDFECIWEKKVTRTLDRNKNNQPSKIERVFTKT